MHLTPANQEEECEGVLMYSEAKKEEQQNRLEKGSNVRIDCEEFAKKTQLSNTALVNKFYLKSVQFTMDGTIEQQRMPRQALPSDCCYFYVTPGKH